MGEYVNITASDQALRACQYLVAHQLCSSANVSYSAYLRNAGLKPHYICDDCPGSGINIHRPAYWHCPTHVSNASRYLLEHGAEIYNL